MSRVLFVHVRKETPEVPMPHLGMGILAAILTQAGHEAVVFDEVLYGPESLPALSDIINQVQPDIIGFSVYTATRDRVIQLIRETRASSSAPILVGGPHAALFPEELANLGCIDYIVCGEAENAIVDVVARAKRENQTEIVVAEAPDVTKHPWPDYKATLGYEKVPILPIMTSRGCPYHCNFCAVHKVSTRRWRPRDPADCVAEIRAAVAVFPKLHTLNVSDDCPTGKPEHFKEFLRQLADAHLGLLLDVNNMRADRVDAELVALLKAAGAKKLCVGVESGNPEVFAMVNKGETLDDIIRAAELIKRGGLELGACFVIGLPGDTFEKHKDSVRLAKRLKPNNIYWNVAHPFPGTAMHDWFVEHSDQIDEPRSYTSYDFHSLETAEPTVSTPEFTKWERQRAYFLAVVETDQYMLDRSVPWRLLKLGLSYRLLGPAFRSMFRRLFFGGFRRLERKVGIR